jgi:tetratricopeptide (TPR) repeat protein
MAEQEPLEPAKKDKQNWLRELLGRTQGQERGDVIAGQVGQQAQGVAIGKNIVQIGALVIPVWPFIVFFILLALVALGWGLSQLGPTQMPTNSFNVAVAQIGELDANGQLQPSDDGAILSDLIFKGLREEYKNLPAGATVTVWHDNLGLTEKRGTIGLIADEATAIERAEALNADLVVYGNLVTDENTVSFAPQFYINRQQGETGEVNEIRGSFQLGGDIPFLPPLDPSDDRLVTFLTSEMGLRATALRWFTEGFILDLAGQTPEAYQTFKQAETELKSWPEQGQGKEILYYFIGRQALFLARNELEAQKSFEKGGAPAARQEAEKYFNLALTSNPAYARAQIGLGGVYFQRAQLQEPAERLAAPDIDEAINYYEQARTDAPKLPGGTQLVREAQLGLAVAAYLKGEAYARLGYVDEALTYFEWTAREIEAILPAVQAEAHQQRSLVHLYLDLGSAYMQQADLWRNRGESARAAELYTQARDAYATCAKQKIPDKITQNIIDTYCRPHQQKAEEALATVKE